MSHVPELVTPSCGVASPAFGLPRASKVALGTFPPISLAELQMRAPLLHRKDNKYVLEPADVNRFVEGIRSRFQILTIDGRRVFSYSSLYFDTADWLTFRDHNKGRRRRFKVRFRHYHDTGLYFFEVKLKGFRKATHKYRFPIDRDRYVAGRLDTSMGDFFRRKIHLHYGTAPDPSMSASIRVDYTRVTLVAKRGKERITIDSNLAFADPARKHILPPDRHIVEVKSVLGRSFADCWLVRNRIRPIRRCSKYSMAVNLLKLQGRNTRFSPTLRRSFGTAY